MKFRQAFVPFENYGLFFMLTGLSARTSSGRDKIFILRYLVRESYLLGAIVAEIRLWRLADRLSFRI